MRWLGGLVLLAMAPASTVFAPVATAQSASADIIVTASRADADPAVASVAQVTADDLSRLQPLSLLDALGQVAGVNATSTGGAAGGSFLSVRGGKSNFTMVLIDGVRVNDPTNSAGGAFDFGTLDPLTVQSITLSRGAGSAVHGSDALSGVVDIHVLNPVRGAPALTATLKGGTLGDFAGNLSLNQSWLGGGIVASGGWFDSGDADGTRLRRAQGLVRAVQSLGSYDLRLLALFGQTDRAGFPVGSGGPLYAVNRTLDIGRGQIWLTAATLTGTAGLVQPHLSLSYSEQRDDDNAPAIPAGALAGVPATIADTRFSRLDGLGYITLTRPWITAAIGGEGLVENGVSQGSLNFGRLLPSNFALRRITISGFGEVTLRPVSRLSINGALRYDARSGGDGRWTGGGAVSYSFGRKAPTLYARIGRGFSLPSLYALGNPLVGNAALRPQSDRDIEVGSEWIPRNQTLVRIAYYDTHFANLIDFDPVRFRLVNRSSVIVRGLETEARTRIGAVDIHASIGYLNFESATPLRAHPSWQGNVRLAWRVVDAFELNATGRFNTRFYDTSIPTGALTTPGHGEADLGARYVVSPSLSFIATVRNLSNSRAQDAVGFPMPGINGRISCVYKGF